MRSRKALINTITSIIYEAVAIVCGLVLPRLILSHLGSSYNGITSSITQFLSCISLMKAGLFGVTRSALYKPLADNDKEQISSIIKTTDSFMKRIALIFAAGIVIFAAIYPVFVSDEFEWFFTFTLVLIVGISTFSQYYFGMTYSILLEADQKKYVTVIFQIICTILNTVIASALILVGFGIHAVKLVSAAAFTLYPILIRAYARKHYDIDCNASKNNELISQRWDAFAQELAYFVHNNTDVIVLTIFTNIKIVSVYTVYNYVISNLLKVIQTFIVGFGAAFGNMLAKKEYDIVKENVKIYEVIIFSLSAIAYSSCLVLIVPFALLYTKGVTDTNYSQPVFAAIITIAGMFSCFRIPYKTVVDAAGHFKQMRNGALMEAILNITVSVICVNRFGLVGVAVGTLLATVFRSVQYASYMMKSIVPMNFMHFVGHVAVNLITMLSTALLYKAISPFFLLSLSAWVVEAAICVCWSACITVAFDVVFYRSEFVQLIKRFSNIWRKNNEISK